MFQELINEMKDATKKHYQKLLTLYPSENIYGYSFFTVDEVPSIHPVANRESEIEVPPTHSRYNYYRYGACEWSEWDDFDLFEKADQLIEDLYSEIDMEADEENDFVQLSKMQQEILDSALIALTELESENVFGDRTDERFLVLWVTDSINPITDKSVKALNTPLVYDKYAAEFFEDIEDDENCASLIIIDEIPESIKHLKIALPLKKVCNLSSSELLKAVKTLPAEIDCTSRKAGIEVAHSLQDLGVQCRVETK